MPFLDLGLGGLSEQLTKEEKINCRKEVSKILSRSRQKAKLKKCYYCGKQVSRFCNSHSVPAFCLRNIAVDGKVYYANTLINLPVLDEEKGVKESGTFKIICPECDREIFKKYENPDNYIQKPSSQMLAQIALKNYLKCISKRLLENEMYNIVAELSSLGKSVAREYLSINGLDLLDYQKGYEKAKRLGKKDWNRDYYLFYYQLLDYTVPIAFQGAIAVISDLEGNTINNIYDKSSDYHIKDLHVCVFPLQNKSAIMLFIDSKDKRYRTFCKQFKKLQNDEKLALINYLIFLYSEDVFISKTISKPILDHINLKEVARKSSTYFTMEPKNSIVEAGKEFDLNNWNCIPNLLDEEYKIE